MKRGALFLALSLAALTGGIGAHTVPPESMPQVNAAAVEGSALPRTLSEYGFFAGSPAAHRPAHGVEPYRLNTPLFSDGAEKLRFAYIPDGQRAVADGEGLLQFPVGSALIKTFAFGEGSERRLIETRVLLHRAEGWVALLYLWNAEQTDAKLAVAGARLDLVTPRGEPISYRVPNKNQCKECHGLDGAVVPIGPKARNLSRAWLSQMMTRGVLDTVPNGAGALPLWEARSGATAQAAARAYLDVNCAHCHRPGATASNSGLDLRWEQDDPHALGVMKRPVAAGRGAGAHLFDVVPGKPDESILLHRMQTNEAGVAMPEVGKETLDPDGIDAVRRWIAEMQ